MDVRDVGPSAVVDGSGRCRLVDDGVPVAEWASLKVLAQRYWATCRGSQRVWPEWRFVRELTHSGDANALVVVQALIDEAQFEDELIHVGRGPLQDLLCVDGHSAKFVDEIERRAAAPPRFRVVLSAVALGDEMGVLFDVPLDVRSRLAGLGVRAGDAIATQEGRRRAMHPSRAAQGGLQGVSPGFFPLMAAHWLQDGFDSQLLRELAAPTAPEHDASRALMPEALRSIGYPIPTESQFAARCDAALRIVQRDLDATGYGRFEMHARNVSDDEFFFEMFAALPDGSSWSGGGVGGMTMDMDEDTLLWHAAMSVSDTLIEVTRVSWPACAIHGQPMRPPNLYEAPHGLVDGAVWWWCRKLGGHAVAPVGELAT
jgi:hypothetical protein